MAVAVFFSRILGLIREQSMAILFGAGTFTDAFLIAFRIPNLFRDLFAEGALSAAFVSVFSKLKDRTQQKSLAEHVAFVLFIVLFVLTAFLYIFAPQLVDLLAGSFSTVPGKFELTVTLTRIILPFLYFTSVAALSMGLLNSLGHYFWPSMGSAAFNVSSIFIGGGLALYFQDSGESTTLSIVSWSVGALVGGLFQWLVQSVILKKESFPALLGWKTLLSPRSYMKAFQDERLKRIIKIMLPSILGVGALQINVMVNTYFASSLQEGSVSWLSYAYRIMHLPLGIFGVSMFMSTLPKLSSLHNNKPEFQKILQKAVNLSIFFAAGSALGLYLFSETLVTLLFGYGEFSLMDVRMTALALSSYAFGLLFFNLQKILVSVFFAFESIMLPSLVSLFSILTNFVLSAYFSKNMGHQGIALSVGLSSMLSVFILFLILSKQGHKMLNRQSLKLFLGLLIVGISFYFVRQSLILDSLLSLKERGSTILFMVYSLLAMAAAGIFYLVLVGAAFPEAKRILLTKLTRKKN